MTQEPLIDVQDLHFRYADGTAALNGIDFRLWPGETVALLGPNGSGKTTLALHLNGLLQGQGMVRVGGWAMRKENLAQIRKFIGFVFQDADEQLFLPTVVEDVAFGPGNLGILPEAAVYRALECLRAVGMEAVAGKAPYHLSAGEKRRVALAGVLAMDPAILVLDEPTTHLDPPGWRDLVRLLQGLPQPKLLITHDIAFARALATRAVFFQKGKIVGEGTLEEVVRQFEWNTGSSS